MKTVVSLQGVTAIVIAGALLSPLGRADVVEPPDESQVSAVARHIQATAAMRVTWAAMLDAVARQDTQGAMSFVLPERRAEFGEFVKRATRLTRISDARGQGGLPCKLSSETTGGCTVIVPTPDGTLEDIHIPFFLRGGVWYINL